MLYILSLPPRLRDRERKRERKKELKGYMNIYRERETCAVHCGVLESSS
jgi:hypothetical protein